MARKGWGSLSDAYRVRLEKNGINRQAYESGQSIAGARGHANTPERPTQANPNKHAGYIQERNKLITAVVTKKHYFFSANPKFNLANSSRPFHRFPPPITALRKWAAYSREEWLDAIRETPETVKWLGYH